MGRCGVSGLVGMPGLIHEAKRSSPIWKKVRLATNACSLACPLERIRGDRVIFCSRVFHSFAVIFGNCFEVTDRVACDA